MPSSSSSATANTVAQVPTATVCPACSTKTSTATVLGPTKAAAKTGKLAAVGTGVGVRLAIALLAVAILLSRGKRNTQALTEEKGWLAAAADQHKRKVEQQRLWIAKHSPKVHKVSGIQEVSAIS